jgi:hypothetical protein
MILAGAYAGEEERARFHAEAEAVARLRHPNVVQIYEVGTHDGRPFFSLEFCPGGNLAGRLRGGPLPAREAAGIVETLARAVQYAHAQGIIHRDLNPANVLLTEDGQVKITDFGLAKQLQGGAGQTRTGAVLGTPSYMAPEQAAGKTRDIGPPADVYALGAILYELLTGRPPFQAATPLDILLQVLDRDPVPIRECNPRLPRDLETVCRKCLEKDPKRRYASAEALADDLRRFGDGEPIRARPPGPVRRASHWVGTHQLLALAYPLGGAALALSLGMIELEHGVFGMEGGVSSAGFYGAVLPLVCVLLPAFALAEARTVTLASLPGALVAGLGWFFAIGVPSGAGGSAWPLRALIGSVLFGTVLGCAVRSWRITLLGLLPAVGALAAVGWYLGPGPGPFFEGAFQGLTLGALCRLVAWGLNREKAASALGVLLGAAGGIVLGDLYAMRLYMALALSGLVPFGVLGLYAEIGVAYLGAIATALLLGRPATAAAGPGRSA